MAKRLLDMFFSLVLLIVLAPALLVVAAAVAVSSGRPVLFKQTRLGMGGAPFGLYKFRSMVKDAAARGSYMTETDDPRITGVGRFLRRTSLDELPQLANVLKGDMSLVGPRPDVPAQVEGYLPRDWAERCRVRPGITGLAQATFRSEGTPAQRLALDLKYVREHSVWLDLKIMIWTLGRLRDGGAN